MPACPNCGREPPPDAAFCPSCGTQLLAPERVREERKLISVLFVDMVGFTSRSDKADPEDVRDTLQGFHARAKQEIERFGGTVEDRKSTRLNSSHLVISYAVFCLKKKTHN